ncbi:MAG: hypothetical protein ACI32Q_07070 [Intestinibaculum porci]|uniref:hypothetical protein n=1 Tax=Intestinibaculum porci TaxID=2487118 RepID=UPI003F114B03
MIYKHLPLILSLLMPGMMLQPAYAQTNVTVNLPVKVIYTNSDTKLTDLTYTKQGYLKSYKSYFEKDGYDTITYSYKGAHIVKETSTYHPGPDDGYDKDALKPRIKKYSYNKKGQISQIGKLKLTYNKDNTVNKTMGKNVVNTRLYNRKKQVVTTKITSKEGGVSITYTFHQSYDKHGNIITVKPTNPGFETAYYKYTYSKKGDITKVSSAKISYQQMTIPKASLKMVKDQQKAFLISRILKIENGEPIVYFTGE